MTPMKPLSLISLPSACTFPFTLRPIISTDFHLVFCAVFHTVFLSFVSIFFRILRNICVLRFPPPQLFLLRCRIWQDRLLRPATRSSTRNSHSPQMNFSHRVARFLSSPSTMAMSQTAGDNSALSNSTAATTVQPLSFVHRSSV